MLSIPASGASASGWIMARSHIGTLACQTAASGKVWLVHIAINGQDF